MSVPSSVPGEAARGRRIGITVALAAIAMAVALVATLQHVPSHAHGAGVRSLAATDGAPGATAFVDVSLPAAPDVFARRTPAAEEDCPTF